MTAEAVPWQKEETLMTAKTYDRQTAKFLAVVGENMPKLSGDVMQGWIQNPKAVQEALKKAFCPPETVIPKFKVWKTINLGTGLKTAEDFRRALRDGGFKLSDWASDILGKPAFATATEETEVDLVEIMVAELGFGPRMSARSYQIYERATKKFGLELCSLEVGFQLRLQYKDQPNSELLFIAMEPIIDSSGNPRLLKVENRDSNLWLDGHWTNYNDFWSLGTQWVFCRPRK